MLYKVFQKQCIAPQTQCIIQFGNLTTHENIKWISLLHPPEHYTVNLSMLNSKGQCQARVFNQNWPIAKARLQITNVEIQFRNPALDLISVVEIKHELSFFEARKIIQITQEEHFIALLLLNNKNKIKVCIKLRAFDQSTPVAQGASLYPALTIGSTY